MKNIYLLLFIFLCIAGQSQTVIPQKGMDSKFSLSVANVYFEIDAARGARITSFKLNDNELMYVEFNTTDMAGSTFWPSPQIWPWPPAVNLDSKPYQSTIKQNKIVFTGTTDSQSMLRFYKTMYANSIDTSIIIEYCIKNEKSTSQKWAPWEITRVLNSGLTLFAKGDGSVTGDMTGRTELLNGYVWYDQDNTSDGSGNKFFCDGKGWLAHVVDGNMLFIKKFDNVATGKAAPNEAEIEVYTAGDKSYTEIENQGSYVTIASKDSIVWRVKWFARKLPALVDVNTGSNSLTDYIENVLKREAPTTKVALTNNVIFKVFPNPVASLLTIETDLPLGKNITLRIIDLQGRIVLTHSVNHTKDQINIEHLKQGNYIYELQQGTKTLSKGQIALNR